jgi:hypothetical protein
MCSDTHDVIASGGKITMATPKIYSSRRQIEQVAPFTLQANAINAIHTFGRFRFTVDGRRYSMTIGGEAIGYLMKANDCPDFEEYPRICEQLSDIAGAIVICNEADQGEGEFLPYGDSNELVNAWYKLADISGVAISEADQEILEMYRTDEEGKEED